MPCPSSESGRQYRTTIALAGHATVNSTYSPGAASFTHIWLDDSVSTRLGPHLGPKTFPEVFISAAKYVVQGMSAPTPVLAVTEPGTACFWVAANIGPEKRLNRTAPV